MVHVVVWRYDVGVACVGYVDLNAQESKPDLQPQALSPFSRTEGPSIFYVNHRPRGFQSHCLPWIPKTHWCFVPACWDRQCGHFGIFRSDVCWRVQGYWCCGLRFARHLELVILVGAACHELSCSSRLFLSISNWLDWSQRAGSCRILELNCSFALVISTLHRHKQQASVFPCDKAAKHPRLKIRRARVLTVTASDLFNIIGLHALTLSRMVANHLNHLYKRPWRGFPTCSLYIHSHLPWSLHWVLPWPIFSQADTRWMDATSCLAAERHCGRSAVTLAVSSGETARESACKGVDSTLYLASNYLG